VAKIYPAYRALLTATDCVCSSLAGDWEFLSVVLFTYISFDAFEIFVKLFQPHRLWNVE
jgi:hypothetical protein